MNLVIVAVATILLISSTAYAQNRNDDICAEVVDDVVDTRTRFVDEGHRAISNATRTALNDRAMQSLIAQIKDRHQAELRANLKKRKQQAKARARSAEPEPTLPDANPPEDSSE